MSRLQSVENKTWWVEHGRQKEDIFVDEVCPLLGLDAQINPDKAANPYAPDLVVDGILSDLKCQRLPFFRAYDFWNIPPQFAVAYNWKDDERYSRHYPDIKVYFWVIWTRLAQVIRGRRYLVKPMWGVWVGTPTLIRCAIELGGSHQYRKRRDDVKGNAKGSYILDVRALSCLSCRTLYLGEWVEVDDYSYLD